MIEQFTDCTDCLLHLASNFYTLKEACASVGIEHGRTTEDEMALYISWFHANGHIAYPLPQTQNQV